MKETRTFTKRISIKQEGGNIAGEITGEIAGVGKIAMYQSRTITVSTDDRGQYMKFKAGNWKELREAIDTVYEMMNKVE